MRIGSWLLFVLLLLGCEAAPVATPTLAKTVTATRTPQIGVEFSTRAPPTVAIVQLSPTPLPTATPTPTATPIVYNVGDGDTIWDIAYLNGTVPDKVLEMNPQLNPDLLKIGDEIVLPPPATPLFETIEGTPVPLEIRVANLQLYETPVGSLWILGEVENLGTFSAENIQVEITLYGDDTTPIGTVSAWVVPGIVPAGAKAPFGTLIRDTSQFGTSSSDAGGYNTTASVVGGSTLVNLGSRFVDLEITEAGLIFEDEQVQVAGMIQNGGAVSAENSQLTITLYDANRNVSGYVQQPLAGLLAPDETVSFSADIAPPGGEAVSFAILAQAQQGAGE